MKLTTEKMQDKIDFLRRLADRNNGDLELLVHSTLDLIQGDLGCLKDLEANFLLSRPYEHQQEIKFNISNMEVA